MNRCPNVHKDGQKSYLVVPVNNLGIMGAGLAKVAAQAFPDASAVYKASFHRFRGGDTLLVDDSQLGYNGVLFAATKTDWRQPSKLEYIDKIGKEMRQWITAHEGYIFFYIPQIGCGLGGLTWDDVSPILSQRLSGLEDNYCFIERA
jgi:hypothetical protein